MIIIEQGSGIEWVVEINSIEKLFNLIFESEVIFFSVIFSNFPNSFNLFSINELANPEAYTGQLILSAKKATAPAWSSCPWLMIIAS